MNPEIKKFWEDQGYEIKTSNHLVLAWKADDNYMVVANSETNIYYYTDWKCYSEQEMLKAIKEYNLSCQ